LLTEHKKANECGKKQGGGFHGVKI